MCDDLVRSCKYVSDLETNTGAMFYELSTTSANALCYFHMLWMNGSKIIASFCFVFFLFFLNDQNINLELDYSILHIQYLNPIHRNVGQLQNFQVRN